MSEESIECIAKSDSNFFSNIIFNWLFGYLKLTKNADLDKYKYTGYSLGFDTRSEFLITDVSYGKNVIIFGVDIRSSVHIGNKGIDILILSKGPTRRLDDTKLTVEAK